MLRPGFEPGLLRPQRSVLTTRRSQHRATWVTPEKENFARYSNVNVRAYFLNLNCATVDTPHYSERDAEETFIVELKGW